MPGICSEPQPAAANHGFPAGGDAGRSPGPVAAGECASADGLGGVAATRYPKHDSFLPVTDLARTVYSRSFRLTVR